MPLSTMMEERVLKFEWQPRRPTMPWAKGFYYYQYTKDAVDATEQVSRICAEAINTEQFDVLFATNCKISGIASIGQYVDIPSVLYLHEPNRRLFDIMPRASWPAPRRDAKMRRARLAGIKSCIHDWSVIMGDRYAMRKQIDYAESYDRVLVNSCFCREHVLRSLGVKSRVCYPGVDTHRLQRSDQRRDRWVLGVGAYAPHKNIPLAIEALSRIPVAKRPALIWIGNSGGKRYAREMKQMAEDGDVSMEILFNVEEEKLVDYYHRAGVLLYTSRLEPFGLVPLEANACGLPVVAIREGGMRESIEEGVNGLLVESEPNAVAAGITSVLDDPLMSEQLSIAGRTKVEQDWNIEDAVLRLEKELEHTVHAS